MHIGLIGGIGPAATVAYYLRLVDAFRVASIPLELTIVHADVSVLAGNAQTLDIEAQAEVFAGHMTQLAAAGCEVAAITALTGHFCLDRTAGLSSIPILSATALIDTYCAAHGIGKLGLLGSPAVLNSHLFGMLKTPKTVVPEGDINELGAGYMAMAMSGTCTPKIADMFDQAAAAMVLDQGADAVLLAGTDLGLAFDGRKVGYTVIDALDIHVDGILSLAAQHHETS